MGTKNLGTFEGFNFREQGAIEKRLTMQDIVGWDHDAEGEAEFWPAGDCPALAKLFAGKSAVTRPELERVSALLEEVDGDDEETLLRLHHLVNLQGQSLDAVTAENIQDTNVHVFRGDCFIDVRKEAAYELFELYWPDLYAIWEKTPMDGLRFDTDHFLDSPSWLTEEIDLGTTRVLMVAPNG